MSTTPYTLMRCRMKDLISCFNACKLPIEKHTHDPKPSSVIIEDPNPNYQRQKKQVKLQTKGGGAESPASWQSCESEEDDDDDDNYIVFYFKDDDAGGGVIEERSLDRSRRKKKHEKGKNQGDAKLVPLDPNDDEHNNTLGGSSDSSTSSFAFPPIQREWTGSPVLMPRPEGSSRSVCIQCCKF